VPGEAAVCRYIRENNLKIPADLARDIVAYLALSLLESGDPYRALSVISQAEDRGVADNRLRGLGEKIEAVLTYDSDVNYLYDNIRSLLLNMENNNTISLPMLQDLAEAIRIARRDLERARSLGLSLDDKPIRFAEDVYNLLSRAREDYNVLSRIDLKGMVSALSNLSSQSIEEYAGKLEALRDIGRSAARYIGQVDRAIKDLQSAKLNTEQARKIRDAMIDSLRLTRTILQAVNNIAIPAWSIGENLSTLMRLIKNAYTSPEESPLHGGGDRAGFVNAFTSIVNSARHIKQLMDRIEVPLSAPDEYAKLIDYLKKTGNAIADSVMEILRNLKYSLTYGDYRWNEVWEDAEQNAGVDLGSISKTDVQRYEYKCDSNGCRLEERGGVLGSLAKHLPEQVLSFFTTVEDFLKYTEMYNRWIMNHADNKFLKGLGYIGYAGANIINSVGQIFAPRMLAENLKAFKDWIGEWINTAWAKNKREALSKAAHDTWNMFFGSKEAAISTLSMLLLAAATGGLMAKGLPKGARIPLRRAVLGNLAQGDIIGAGLAVVERMLPAETLRTIARGLATKGAIRASELVDEAGLLERAAEKAERTSRIKAVLHAGDIQRIIGRALKNTDNLKLARENIERYVMEEGLDNLKRDIEEYKAAKQIVVSNLADMEIHAPSLLARIKKALAEKLGRGSGVIPAEEVTAVSTGELESLAKKKLEEGPYGLVRELSEAGAVPRDVAEKASRLAETARELEKAGRKSFADALRRIEGNLARLKGEVGRLRDLEEALESLERLKEKAVEKGLWRDYVKLNKRKLGVLPERIENLGKMIEEYRNKALNEYELRHAKAVELEKTLHSLRLGLGRGTVFTREALRKLADALVDLGYEDLAAEVEKYAAGEKTPRLARLGELFDRLGERLVGDAVRKAELEKAGLKPGKEMFKETGLSRILEKPYILGLKAGELLGRKLIELGEKLRELGLARYEERLARRIADTIKKEYENTAKANYAFLKGVLEALEGYEKTPIGALLADLEGSLRQALEVAEKELGPGTFKMSAKPAAVEKLRELVSKDNTRFLEAITGLDNILKDITERMRSSLEKVEGGERVSRLVDKLLERTNLESIDPDEFIDTVKKTVEEEGIHVPDEYWRKLGEYIDALKTREELTGLVEELSRGGSLTLDEIQRAIDALARVNVEEAWKADWTVVREYLRDIRDILERARNLELPRDLKVKIENLEDRIRQVAEKTPGGEGIARTVEELEANKKYSLIASQVKEITDILARGLGEDKVKGLRRLVDEFEEKLGKGVFDENLLKRIRREIWKLKLRSLPAKIRADLARLANKLKETALRLGKGKQAALLEKALNQLADDILRAEEEMPEVEGWVRITRALGVEKGRLIAVPKGLADRLAEIFSTPEKPIKVTTKEGIQATLRRTVRILGDNVLEVKYELEFPGNRKITYVEVSKAAPEGHVYTYKTIHYDPATQRALLKYEEARKGLGGMDEEARIGEAINETLEKTLEELDPDYKILRKISFIGREGVKPAFPDLAMLPAEILREIYKPILPTLIAGENKRLQEELESSLPGDLAEKLEEAVKRVSRGLASQGDLALLALTEPVAGRLREAYENLLPPEADPSIHGLESILGDEAEALALKPEDWSIAGAENYNKIYLVLPKPSPSIIDEFENPRKTVTITLPDGTTVTLPAIEHNGTLYIILPPFTIQLPDQEAGTLNAELEKQKLKPLEIQGTRAVEPLPVRHLEPGTAAAPPPPPPPVLPVIPWKALGKAVSGGVQREKIHI